MCGSCHRGAHVHEVQRLYALLQNIACMLLQVHVTACSRTLTTIHSCVKALACCAPWDCQLCWVPVPLSSCAVSPVILVLLLRLLLPFCAHELALALKPCITAS
eukprot:482552-Pelagomonas_calceolata.AAC.5